MSVSSNIQRIQELFQEVQQQINSTNYKRVLAAYSDEYLSVAYEAAAAAIAEEDLRNADANFTRWNAFCAEFGDLHGSQIHVGLGWTLSENTTTDLSFLNTFESRWKWRVIDGMGYYSGLFKRRDSIRNQQLPVFLDPEDIHAFDQGLGRCLWYLSQGDTERLMNLIQLFSSSRRADLWRGVGLAASYVGGLSKALLEELLKLADTSLSSFKCGALLSIAARQKAMLQTKNSIMIQNELGLTNPTHMDLVFSEKGSYYSLLQEIELTL